MNLERVANFLASGLKPSQVATIIGVSPARISQLLAQDNFKTLLQSKMAESEKSTDEIATLDNKYLAVEHSILNTIQEQVAAGADLRDCVQALRVITERQFRKASITTPASAGTINITQQTVVLNLPKHALPDIALNESNEVISIDNRTLAPLTSNGVTNLFQQMKGKKNEPTGIPLEASSSSEEALQTLEIS